ncbi:MAG: flagellar basal body-associated FliL family protein [Pseudomonadota bacterium]
MKYAIIGVLVLLIAGAAGLYFTGIVSFGAPEVAEVDAEGNPVVHKEITPPLYLPLEPPFVVNFTHRGTLRYLQLSLELMYHNESILQKVTDNMPAIRNDLILLFSNQEYETLSTLEGKEELRDKIMLAVNNIVTHAEAGGGGGGEHGGASAEALPAAEEAAELAAGDVYITNFVMQ